MSAVRVANAPCSYGAFEITVGVLPNVPAAEDVLAAIAGAALLLVLGVVPAFRRRVPEPAEPVEAA
jgi:hypothetical protein